MHIEREKIETVVSNKNLNVFSERKTFQTLPVELRYLDCRKRTNMNRCRQNE